MKSPASPRTKLRRWRLAKSLSYLTTFSPTAEAVPVALSKLRPCGDYHAVSIDAVTYAIHMLSRRRNHYRRAILLIREMRDYGSRAKLDEVVAQLGMTDTVIYSPRRHPTRPHPPSPSPCTPSIRLCRYYLRKCN